MSDELTRIQMDKGVTNKLNNLTKGTRLRPNHLGRIGLCYSLSEPRPPSLEEYDARGKEFTRHTLLGEEDALYIALVRQRMINEGFDPDEELEEYFLAHLNRGVDRLSGRLGDLTDLYDLIPEDLKKEAEAQD